MSLLSRLQPTLLALAAVLGLTLDLCAQTSRDIAAEVTATVQESPARIILNWNNTPLYQVATQTIYRRLKDAPTWVQIATPVYYTTTYTDSAVSAGVSYEYRVARTFNGGPVYSLGYISAGIRVPLVTDRGRAILLVDSTMSTPLANELATFTSDLTGDGWTVVRADVSRTATPPTIRATIQSLRNADPAHTAAVILFGHIPVPYSGDFAVDGHPDHFGAWPTDAYYGDMDGTWTDTFVNDSAAGDPRNRNVPGDGKFDQTFLPSDIELQVGRIDLANMPGFDVNETELLRRYLTRDHNYRHQLGTYASVGQRALVDDNFGYFGGEAFAVGAWRGFTPCVGAGNVQELDWFTTLQTQSYLMAYGCGGGSYLDASGVGTSSDFATKDSRAVFNVMFGSYFGDWDYPNSFLRAPLAGTASGLGLTNCWSGRPHWVLHSMSMGETIGYATRVTQNNDNAGGNGYDPNAGAHFNSIALLGDPTLRLYPVAPPASFSATASGSAVALNWSASTAGAIEGYLVARAPTAAGPFKPLRGALVTETSFVDRTVVPGASYAYLVRAVRLETSPSGTFLNPSQGVFSGAVTAPAASGAEINVSGNGQPVVAGDTSAMTANGTDLGGVETVATATTTFTITNPGPAPLTIGSAGISGPNAGDFTITAFPPASVAAGGSATCAVRFAPSAVGARAAKLTLATNDTDEATFDFPLGGTGLPPHAEIAVYPPAIDRSIHAGDSAVESLEISDPGPGALQHTITSSLTRYSALSSDSFAGPTYAWTDISGTGTEITGWSNNDDALSPAIALGFSFPFYGSNFTTVRVCTNGFLTFTDFNLTAGNTSLPDPHAAANMIAPFWTDLLLDASSHIYTQNVGGSFIVQYQNVSLFGNASARVTCQAILKPGGEIVFQYNAVTAGIDYTIGLQNAAKSDALLVSAHTAFAHAGLALRIRPPGAESWLSLASNSGTVAPGATQSVATTLNATGLTPGNYSAELSIASNAQNSAAILVPVHLTVGNTPVENWRLEKFGSTAGTGTAADDANPDGDSRVNLIEYAFDSSPTTASPPDTPTISPNPSGYLQIQFPRHTARTDLRYLVEATSDLTAPWSIIARSVHGALTTASGAHSCAESGVGAVKTVAVEDTAPTASFTTRYLRLRVVRD